MGSPPPMQGRLILRVVLATPTILREAVLLLALLYPFSPLNYLTYITHSTSPFPARCQYQRTQLLHQLREYLERYLLRSITQRFGRVRMHLD